MYSFFDESKESLVGYYILPMIKLSFKTFGPFFKSAHLNRDGTAVRVTMSAGCREPFWENSYYQTDWTIGGTTFALFAIPEREQEDVALFMKGKYSKMSESVKLRIYRYSGLFYNKQIQHVVVTDMKLLVLTKSPILKQWIYDNYGIRKGKNSEFIQLKNKESIFYNDQV